MKNTNTNKLTVTVLIASLTFLSLPASAGQDESQRYVTQQAHKKLQQAKEQAKANDATAAIKAEECKKLMEHGKNVSGA